MYVVRCTYHEGIEQFYLYWSNVHGWTDAIEDADIYPDKKGMLPMGQGYSYTDVEWVELKR